MQYKLTIMIIINERSVDGGLPKATLRRCGTTSRQHDQFLVAFSRTSKFIASYNNHEKIGT